MARRKRMTESAWFDCHVPSKMLELLGATSSERKLRLWACAAAERCFPKGSNPKAALSRAERFADGERPTDRDQYALYYVCKEPAWTAAYTHVARAVEFAWVDSVKRTRALELQSELIREICGNPFRPVPFNPEWCTNTAVELASQMYESREFSAMPILADVLQDAGCDNEDILSHCRGKGPHVRGCWVVDLVLGKS